MMITLESVEIDPEELKTRKADDRGRINLGSEFTDKQVTMLLQFVDDADEDV